MYHVCAKYCGAVIELENFEDMNQTTDFMKQPMVLFYKDEIEGGEEDEVIYPNEMWIEENMSFDSSWITSEFEPSQDELDDLPF